MRPVLHLAATPSDRVPPEAVFSAPLAAADAYLAGKAGTCVLAPGQSGLWRRVGRARLPGIQDGGRGEDGGPDDPPVRGVIIAIRRTKPGLITAVGNRGFRLPGPVLRTLHLCRHPERTASQPRSIPAVPEKDRSDSHMPTIPLLRRKPLKSSAAGWTARSSA